MAVIRNISVHPFLLYILLYRLFQYTHSLYRFLYFQLLFLRAYFLNRLLFISFMLEAFGNKIGMGFEPILPTTSGTIFPISSIQETNTLLCALRSYKGGKPALLRIGDAGNALQPPFMCF